jgi:hypothetical protein
MKSVAPVRFHRYNNVQRMLKRLFPMKETESNFLKEASDAVAQCFADVPFCTFKWGQREAPIGEGRHVDRLGKLKIEGGKERTVLLEVKKNGQPRFVREAANALARNRENFKDAYGIVAAPFISEDAGALLAAEDLGYVDFAGNCRIILDRIYIRKEGKANRFTEKRDLRSLYSPKGECILRVLMLNPQRAWLVKALAEQAGVSLGQVSNVKKLLEAREWVQTRESGFSLAQPEALLQEWSSTYRFSRSRSCEFYAMASLEEIEKGVAGEGAKRDPLGVLTSFSAAARLAPAVRYQRAAAYVRKPADEVAKELGWKPVTSGGNVSLIEPYDNGVFLGEREVDGVRIVSPVQTYLDVQGNVGRGAEAAEALLQEVLRPSW